MLLFSVFCLIVYYLTLIMVVRNMLVVWFINSIFLCYFLYSFVKQLSFSLLLFQTIHYLSILICTASQDYWYVSNNQWVFIRSCKLTDCCPHGLPNLLYDDGITDSCCLFCHNNSSTHCPSKLTISSRLRCCLPVDKNKHFIIFITLHY